MDGWRNLPMGAKFRPLIEDVESTISWAIGIPRATVPRNIYLVSRKALLARAPTRRGRVASASLFFATDRPSPRSHIYLDGSPWGAIFTNRKLPLRCTHYSSHRLYSRGALSYCAATIVGPARHYYVGIVRRRPVGSLP